MDGTDRKILDEMQRDASLSVGALAERVGISKTACWRRIHKLEDCGVIRTRVTLLDADKVNLPVTAYATVRTSQHHEQWLERFTRAVDRMPEVLEFYRMSGDVDYLLKVVATDIHGYDEIYKRLIRAVELMDVSTGFVMETLKHTTVLPLDKL